MVRVRENYQRGLLIGNDSRMNGRLNSEAAGRKILRAVDFRAAWQAARTRQQTLLPSNTSSNRRGWLEFCRVKVLRLSVFQVHDLVHDLNQALRDRGESGALELRVDLRRTCLQ